MYRMASAAVTTDTGLNLSASYTYEDDLLTKIQTTSTTYNFTYGNFGLRSSVKVGTQTLAGYTYTQDGNNYLSSLDYGNGDKVQYEYDNLGRVTKQTYEDGDTVTYKYDNSGALATVEDSATGRKTTYYYDFTDRLMKYVETGTNYYHSVGYEYDQLNNLTSLMETINGTDYTTSYAYDDDNRVASVTTNGTTVEYTYDAYGRISQQVTKRGDTTILTETYTYVGTDTTTSGQIATYKTETANYSVTYSYTYDDNGNILSVNDGTYTTSYVYDSANQLIRENNQRRNRSYTWAYDNAGNILSQKAYVYTTGDITESTATVATNSYTYGDENWGDLLTAYNGAAISYDEIGNPDGYGDRTFTWEHGRQMATQTRNGVTWMYTYDANGMRTKRSSDSKTYEYVYSGDKLLLMTVTDHTTSPETVQFMEFSYDAAGQPLTFTIDGVTYYYVLNIQGDVMGMVDGDGNLLYTMVYEGYGAGYYFSGGTAAATMLLNTNPLGYRGYVMDAGTGLYYLQSRYYDPALGRFINADAYTSTGQGLLGNNMFAYCLNNPVMYFDTDGRNAEAAAATWGATMWWLCLVDAYLPIGDAIYAVVLTVLLVTVAVSCTSSSPTEPAQNKKDNSGSSEASPSIAVGGTASPPPPNNKKPGISFSKNSVFKRVYDKNGVAIDYEYNGNGTGNVHMHVKNGKYHYDTRGYFKTGPQHSDPQAPPHIQRYLQDDAIVAAIMKALETLKKLGAYV